MIPRRSSRSHSNSDNGCRAAASGRTRARAGWSMPRELSSPVLWSVSACSLSVGSASARWISTSGSATTTASAQECRRTKPTPTPTAATTPSWIRLSRVKSPLAETSCPRASREHPGEQRVVDEHEGDGRDRRGDHSRCRRRRGHVHAVVGERRPHRPRREPAQHDIGDVEALDEPRIALTQPLRHVLEDADHDHELRRQHESGRDREGEPGGRPGSRVAWRRPARARRPEHGENTGQRRGRTSGRRGGRAATAATTVA